MNIVVLAGGTSTEREVSLISGTGIYRALRERGHRVVLLDVYLGLPDLPAEELPAIFEAERDWAEGIEAIREESPSLEKIREMRPDGGRKFFGPNVLEICALADVVFLALHGANGEDGRIQAVFDLSGIRYTGTDYLSSAICMDKALTKEIIRSNALPTPEGFSARLTPEGIAQALNALDTGCPEASGNAGASRAVCYPAVIKVNNGGSSVGVYIVKNRPEAEEAFRQASEYDNRVVVERFIAGREITCGILGGRALPLIEIVPAEGFYDYKNKYQPGKTKEICPAPISAEKTEEIQRTAEEIYRVLHLRSYARLDFRMDEDGAIYCLEANTLPGMTPVSLLPQAALETGLDYGALCERIIEISLEEQER